MTADAITAHRDLELATLPDDLRKRIDTLLPPRWSRNNPIDLAGGETRDTIPQVLELVAGHPDVDAVIYLGLGIQSNQARMLRDGGSTPTTASSGSSPTTSVRTPASPRPPTTCRWRPASRSSPRPSWPSPSPTTRDRRRSAPPGGCATRPPIGPSPHWATSGAAAVTWPAVGSAPRERAASPEPLRGEPPVLTHDPASRVGPDASVRVVGAPVASTGDRTTIDRGPVPALELDRAAPVPVAPAARRRHRRRWFSAAAVLAVLGAGCLAAAVLRSGGAERAHGAPAALRLATPVLSARRSPDLLRRPVAARAVRAAIDPVVARFPDAPCVVVSDGRTDLAATNPTTPLAPASNTKLLTASAALHVLGADTTLQTTVAAAAAPQAGRGQGTCTWSGAATRCSAPPPPRRG